MVSFLLSPITRFRISPKDKDLYLKLRKGFGIKPRNLELYRIALIHKSASTFRALGKRVNNERLEYLGDAVLDAIVADYLFANFPTQKEGFLTKMRSRIVSRQSLNALAIEIGLDKLVVTQTTNTLAQKHIYGDALEAFVGALYLDKGFRETSKWVLRHIFNKHINLSEVVETETDYKSRLIEWGQKKKVSVVFECRELEQIKGGAPLFEARIFVDGKQMGSGIGNTKKEAEQNASLVTIERADIYFSSEPSTEENSEYEN